MSLWRKRKSCDNIAPNVVANVYHNEQKPDHLVNILNKLHDENVRLGLYEGVYDLSIKSEDLSIKSNMIWVDPPEGWRYGFPAIYDPASDGVMRDWIISKGYPVKLIQEYGDVWFVRCWSAEEPH